MLTDDSLMNKELTGHRVMNRSDIQAFVLGPTLLSATSYGDQLTQASLLECSSV